MPRVRLEMHLRSCPIAVLIMIAGFAAALTGCDLGQTTKQNESMVRIRNIAVAVQAYREAHGEYLPAPEGPVFAVLPEIQRFASEPLLASDAWGRPIEYVSSGLHYAVWSWGRNGQRDVFPGGGAHEGYDVDLVFTEDEFWQGHAGVCCYSGTSDPFTQIAEDTAQGDSPSQKGQK